MVQTFDVHECPACGYEGLDEPAWNGDSPSGDICPCCGMQFGYYDLGRRVPLFYEGWRIRWLVEGGHWWSRSRLAPDGWSADRQVEKFKSA